jgi:hypothetical protein
MTIENPTPPPTTTTEAQERAAKRAAAKRAKLEQTDREITALETARAAVEAHRVAAEALAADVVDLDAAADVAIDALCTVLGATSAPSDARRESLRVAVGLGAEVDVMRTLALATRLNRKDWVPLPAGRHAGLSRGRDWCRSREGGGFADRRDGGGFRGTPGKWEVGSTDGYSRKDKVAWDVSHVQVGAETWTVAV